MIIVFLLLGSNLGDRHFYLEQAAKCIVQEIATVIKSSSVFETQAWGKTDTPEYLNQVLALETNLPAQIILERVLNIELALGRTREEKWGPRTIDIDILFYGNEVINEKNLQVPHPELHKRLFTLAPLAEIAPDLVHPVLNKTILEIKRKLNDSLIVKKL